VVLQLAFVMTIPKAIALIAAGIVAGVFNAIAGGGTLITFPTLLAIGVPSLTANITSSVGIVPTYFGSVIGSREEVLTQLPRVKQLLIVTFLGGALGSVLLLTTPAASFRAIVPWLVAFATVLFIAQPYLILRLAHLHDSHPTRKVLLQLGTFIVSIYGGYFGAGVGIMLLALLGLGLSDSLSRINSLRTVLSIILTLLSATIFAIHGHVLWSAALCVAVGSLAGGLGGARIAQFLSPVWLRRTVIIIGTATTISLFL